MNIPAGRVENTVVMGRRDDIRGKLQLRPAVKGLELRDLRMVTLLRAGK